jgi:hypothetical protein
MTARKPTAPKIRTRFVRRYSGERYRVFSEPGPRQIDAAQSDPIRVIRSRALLGMWDLVGGSCGT